MGTPPPQDMQARLSAAVAQIKNGDFEAAEMLLHAALAAEPKHPVALYLMGLTRIECGRWSEAEEFLRRALVIAPGQPDVCLHLAQCLRALQRPVEALEYCRMVLGARPTDSGAWLELAKAQEESGAMSDAEVSYRQMLAHGQAPEAVLNYSRFLNGAGRAPEAEAILRRALAEAPARHG